MVIRVRLMILRQGNPSIDFVSSGIKGRRGRGRVVPERSAEC